MNAHGLDRAAAAVGIELYKPTAAKVQDWLLGGFRNWPMDREFGERAVQRLPSIRHLTIANRQWLGRVINAAFDAGITQFVDLGCGLPSPGAAHESLSRRADDGRLVYVDNDLHAIHYMAQELEDRDHRTWAVALHGDLRTPKAIFSDPEVEDLLDLAQPICVLVASVLPFVGDETHVPDLLGRYRTYAASGSWLAISHIANDAAPDAEQAAQVAGYVDSYRQTPTPMRVRDRAEIESWLNTWGNLLAPGIVHLQQWHPHADHGPDDDRSHPFSWCGVSRKPTNR